MAWIGEKPLYLFLDDYTIPIVTREVQRVLNPIVFNRRSKLFFKISTESSNSFERHGLRGKPLELLQDFELIDLATESLHQDGQDKTMLLENIFKPRIARHESFKEKNFYLSNVLGKTSLSNNELAKRMRGIVQGDDSTQKENGQRVFYHGLDVFIGMWTSDTRIMIQMFTEMLRDANGAIKKGEIPIPENVQDKIYRNTGGELLKLMGSVVDPAFWEKGPSSTGPGERYGTHLKAIVEAFVKVSRYELTEGALVSNEGRMNPKQAFRLEVIDKFDLSVKAEQYFEGLIRWHIFLQDWRGKSVRGMITPRLYLNRILIPLNYAFIFRYAHPKGRNRINQLRQSIAKIGVPMSQDILYNAKYPQKIEDLLHRRLESVLPQVDEVVVDISAMTKLLILVCLCGLRKFTGKVRIIYSEPESYAPTEEEYQRSKDDMEMMAKFPSQGVESIIRLKCLSSIRMQGQPVTMIAFTSFNEQLVRHMLGTISPHRLLFINGSPPREDFAWSERATQEIHKRLIEVAIPRFSEFLESLQQSARYSP